MCNLDIIIYASHVSKEIHPSAKFTQVCDIHCSQNYHDKKIAICRLKPVSTGSMHIMAINIYHLSKNF